MVDAAPNSFLEVPMQLQPLKIKNYYTACQGQSQSSEGATAKQTFAVCWVGSKAARDPLNILSAGRRTPPGPEKPDSRPGLGSELGWGGGASGEEKASCGRCKGSFHRTRARTRPVRTGLTRPPLGPDLGQATSTRKDTNSKIVSSAFAHLPAATDGAEFR